MSPVQPEPPELSPADACRARGIAQNLPDFYRWVFVARRGDVLRAGTMGGSAFGTNTLMRQN